MAIYITRLVPSKEVTIRADLTDLEVIVTHIYLSSDGNILPHVRILCVVHENEIGNSA